MNEGRAILADAQFALVVDRMCHQLIEVYDDFEGVCMVGMQPRGVLFADRLVDRLHELLPEAPFEYGKLDITFYRDDFRMRDRQPLRASATEMDFLVQDKRVLLVDDVLYTGRSVLAALTALQHYGRPKTVDLVALVDRRFNRHLPIKSNFVGITIDALDKAYVKVEWENQNGADQVLLFPERFETNL